VRYVERWEGKVDTGPEELIRDQGPTRCGMLAAYVLGERAVGALGLGGDKSSRRNKEEEGRE
jgi:hypothetical protein